MIRKLRDEKFNNGLTDFWLTTESFNKLLKEAENLQLTNEGVLQFEFKNGDTLGVTVGNTFLCKNSEFYYAKIIYFNGERIGNANAQRCEIL